jgi:hypothetical protein
MGACGMRLVCLLLKRTGLKRFVGASDGTPPRGNRHVAEAMVADRQEERTRLAQARPPTEITMPLDATCTGGLCLVGMDPESNSIVLEHTAPARAPDPWQALLAPALVGLHCPGMQATSAEAPGLLASGAHHRGAHHSPDLVPVPHALSQAVSAPMAAKQRAAAKAITTAEETRKQGQAQPQSPNAPLERRGPGRSPNRGPEPGERRAGGGSRSPSVPTPDAMARAGRPAHSGHGPRRPLCGPGARRASPRPAQRP